MEITKLRYFYEVAKFQHVTRAAEHLHIAQPALTQAIKSLEKEFGVSLFYKQGRNIYLTEYGKYLQAKLDKIIPELDGIVDEIASMRNTSKKIINLNIVSASILVIGAIMEYKKENPEVIFNFSQKESQSGWDIQVSAEEYNKKVEKNTRYRKVVEEGVCLAVPKDSVYAEKGSVKLLDLTDEGFVTLSGFRRFRAICDKYCASIDFSPKIIFESDSLIAVQNIIGSGMGIGFFPAFSWGKPQNDKVKLVELEPYCSRQIVIELAPKSPMSQCAEDFFHHLSNYVDKLSK